MIAYNDILSLQYLSTQTFSGSYRGMRYRVSCSSQCKKVKDMNAENSELVAEVWPEPLGIEAYGPENTVKKTFAYGEEGRTAAIDWLNSVWQSEYSGK